MKLNDPVGQPLVAPHPGKIIGVVKDFHSSKLQFKIQPVIIAMKPVRTQMMFVRYEAGQTHNVIGLLEDIHRKIEPDRPLEWKLMDDPLGDQYRDELLINKLSVSFTAIAIVISCLGLIGLVTYTSETRAKEIGIRKVMGASVQQVLTLLLRDFVFLLAIALLIGSALGWFATEQYLEDYAFRTRLDGWTIGLTASILGVISVAAVSYQSGKAATADPVKTLARE
jgi:ABC-type antimicrobial peptide transport system permease subunit